MGVHKQEGAILLKIRKAQTVTQTYAPMNEDIDEGERWILQPAAGHFFKPQKTRLGRGEDFRKRKCKFSGAGT